MLIAGFTVAGAAPAHAGVVHPDRPVVCDRNETDLSFGTVSAVRTLTHVRYFSIPAGGSIDTEDDVTKIASITASVKFTSDTTVEANEVIAKESEKVGIELAASGTMT